MNAFSQWLGQLQWNTLIEMAVVAAASLLCVSIHELCHGLAAYAMGDPTAKRAGRLTLNPLKHMDLVGFAMIVLFKVGWWKPVPVDPRRFKNPKLGMVLTALAGPASNVALCVFAACGYSAGVFALARTGNPVFEWVWMFFYLMFYLSAGLAVFNLLPIPPLDGSKVLFAVLPPKWYWTLMRYERYGMAVLVVLLTTGMLDVPLELLRQGLVDWIAPVADGFYILLEALVS